MGRVVRVLTRVPAVRRLVLRLASIEAAVANLQSSLDAHDQSRGQVSADWASQQAKLQEAVAEFERQQQAEAATRAIGQAQQTQIDALRVQVRQLAADNEKYSATLAEVSQHLPPAQRANLEATLHGQQLQLGALNSTITAQQMQLAALNEIVRKITTDLQDKRAAVVGAEGGRRDDKRLPAAVSRDPNPDEIRKKELLELGGGKGTVYHFDDLLQRQDLPAPPLIFLHVPKAAGSTLNSFLMKNYKFRADSRGNSFSRYTPRELIGLASAPISEDDRIRPGFFTGHIDLDNEIFHSMPVRYVAITLLRDPIERAISHYRFNSTQPSVFQDAIRSEGLSVVDYCRKFAGAVATQYSVFAPDSGVDVALRRLEDEVSFFGLQSEFEQFVEALGRLLGFPTNTYKMLNVTDPDAAGVTKSQISELQSLFADDITFYNRAVKIYHERLTKMPKLGAEHPWTRFYS